MAMSSEPFAIRRIDHVRFFVGNARQSAYFYRNAFGFDVVAYAGLETKVRHEAGYVLRQGEITFVLVSPLSKEHPDSQRLVTHGDGVMDIAMDVPDVRGASKRRSLAGQTGEATRSIGRQIWRLRNRNDQGLRRHDAQLHQSRSLSGGLYAGLSSRSIPIAMTPRPGTRSAWRQSITSSAMSKKAR